MRKRWLAASYDKDLAAQIAEEHSLNPIAALLAVIRGLRDNEEIEDFFDPNPFFTLDPFALPDMDKAVERINRAIDNFECIAIFGDFDADGVTSTALLYTYLESKGANVLWYIPDRLTEGYGLSVGAVEKLKDMGAQLIVTVDNGVSAADAAERAYELGMEVVITDHHKVPDVLPRAEAIVDLQRADCTSPFKELCGAGVAFKLACAMELEDDTAVIEDFADLAAIGTISDVVNLTGENRAIVKAGLRSINNRSRAGINELLDVAGAGNKYVNATSVAFTISPRINAAGRMGSANRALELLLSDDPETANGLAQEINEANRTRQAIESEIFAEVEQKLFEHPEIRYAPVIVVDGDDWHNGVIGIVAARIQEKYSKPCIIISRNTEDGTARGSGRSIEGFSLYDAIKNSKHLLTHFGGHTQAAGLSLMAKDIEQLRSEITEYSLNTEMPFPVQNIDLKINPAHISLDILDAVSSLEPFGAGNPQPVFGLYGMKIEGFSPVGNGKHMRITVSKGDTRIFAMYFGMTERSFFYSVGDTVDLAVNLDRNEYQGSVRIGVYIRNMRPSGSDDIKVLEGLRLFDRVMHGDELTVEQARAALPDRSLCGAVYTQIKRRGSWRAEYEMLCLRSGFGEDRICAVASAVEVMVQTGVLNRSPAGSIVVNEQSPKVNLEDAQLMKHIRSFL